MAVVINGTSGITGNTGTLISASTIGVGGATPSASGAGITFPATQSASTNANTLDDYEEGTWSPQLFSDGTQGTSYTSQTGYYVKIGKQVMCWFQVQCTLVGGTYMRIGNLPFSVGTSGTAYQVLSYVSGGGRLPIYLETYLGTGGQAFQVAAAYANPASFSGVALGGVYSYIADA